MNSPRFIAQPETRKGASRAALAILEKGTVALFLATAGARPGRLLQCIIPYRTRPYRTRVRSNPWKPVGSRGNLHAVPRVLGGTVSFAMPAPCAEALR